MNGTGSEQLGPLGYFELFFRQAGPLSRVILIAYFAVFLLTPLYGLPHDEQTVPQHSIAVVTALAMVQVLALSVIIKFNRRIPSQLQGTGRNLFLVIFTIFLLFALSFILTLFILDVPSWALRAMTSLAMTIPLILVIFVMVQSIISMGRANRAPRLPILLAFVMIFLLICTFGTFYFINGLLVRTDAMPVTFEDSLFASGPAFTSLGFMGADPVGFGEMLAIFESVSGYITIALITTIFFQIVLGERKE